VTLRGAAAMLVLALPALAAAARAQEDAAQ
jgi:hypothetical protein